MIRFFDFFISISALVFLFPLLVFIFLIGLFVIGSPMFSQTRVGRHEKLFTLIKYRTMPVNTKSVATHLNKNVVLTPFGSFLRKTKLDELPQLWNVLLGDMSLVGPRPCLNNQKKLIKERKKRGVFSVRPGITGLGQIEGITMKNPTLLAKKDEKMIKQLDIQNYFYFIFKTILTITKKF